MAQPNLAAVPLSSPESGWPRRRPSEHYDTTPIRRVSAEQWRDVWSQMGLQSLDGSDGQVLELVVELLTAPGAPAFVHPMLQALHDVGTVQGAHALHDAAIELGINRTGWPNGAEDLAVAVWARSTVDRQYERLLTIAEVTVHERATEDRFREYFGARAVKAKNERFFCLPRDAITLTS